MWAKLQKQFMPISTTWSENFLTKLHTFIPLTIKIIFYHEHLLSNKTASCLTIFPVYNLVLNNDSEINELSIKGTSDLNNLLANTESKMSEIKGTN